MSSPALEPPRSFHDQPTEAVLRELGVTPSGLDEREAAQRRALVGPNTLPKPKRKGALASLWDQIRSPLVVVLIASAVAALALGKLIDGFVVLGVVVVNALLGTVQEIRAGKAIDALVDLVPERVTVARDGVPRALAAAELVPGDVVTLGSGDKVSADMRLLSVKNLRVDESSLTGESLPSDKRVEPVAAGAPIAERASLVHAGTLVAAGTATAVVVRTGASTELGRISTLLRAAQPNETPLTRSLARVGQHLTLAILVVAGGLVVIALLRGYPTVDAVLSGLSLAVAAIPEGLPAIVTIALAIGVRRMAARNALIRKLPAVETLGSTTVICSDKTGTLTRNEMTVQALWAPSGEYRLSGVGYEPAGRLLRDGAVVPEPPPDVEALARAALLCNDAALVRAAGRADVTGDPTEGALVVAAAKLGLEASHARASWPRVDVIPFESEHKYMATVNRAPDGERVVLLKGAPEVVVPRCARIAGSERLDVACALEVAEGFARRGMRVLAVARWDAPPPHAVLDDAHVASGGTLLGLVGMIDPPRPEAIDAIAACRRAGITVKMITGDHPSTAEAIGRQLGLVREGRGVVAGRTIDATPEQRLGELAAGADVFARVAPEHKLRLVKALQRRGEVVAMTGDGVNDAPALRQADIGVAMGITGTSAAKQASDVVLANDDFTSIRAAVEEGRRVYDNLTKAIAFILPTNVGLSLAVLLAVALFPLVGGRPLIPILPVKILWINLVTSVALSLPLAFEAKEPDAMQRPPRRPGAPILGPLVLRRTLLVGGLMTLGTLGLFGYEYVHEVIGHVDPALALREAQTMTVNTVVLFQLFYLFNCRSLRGSVRAIGLFSNPAVWIGSIALVLLQIGFVYLPFMNRAFGSAPLGVREWVLATLVAATVLPIVALEKRLTRGRARGEPSPPKRRGAVLARSRA